MMKIVRLKMAWGENLYRYDPEAVNPDLYPYGVEHFNKDPETRAALGRWSPCPNDAVCRCIQEIIRRGRYLTFHVDEVFPAQDGVMHSPRHICNPGVFERVVRDWKEYIKERKMNEWRYEEEKDRYVKPVLFDESLAICLYIMVYGDDTDGWFVEWLSIARGYEFTKETRVFVTEDVLLYIYYANKEKAMQQADEFVEKLWAGKQIPDTEEMKTKEDEAKGPHIKIRKKHVIMFPSTGGE